MKELDIFDISTLYKDLVILREDRDQEAEEKPVDEGANTEVQPKPEVKKPSKKITIKAPAPKTPFDGVQRAVVCTKLTKQQITAENSSLFKIAQALSIPLQDLRFISLPEIKSKSWLESIETLWFIGLSKEQEAKLQGLGKNRLFSPNPELLETVEEKRAMYEPIKNFAQYLQ